MVFVVWWSISVAVRSLVDVAVIGGAGAGVVVVVVVAVVAVVVVVVVGVAVIVVDWLAE